MFTLISGQQWKLALVAQPPLVLLYLRLSSHLLNSYKSKLNFVMMTMVVMTTMVVMVMTTILKVFIKLTFAEKCARLLAISSLT